MINDRIDTLINRLCNGNKSLFAKKIGVTPSVIGNITGERKGNPSFDVIKKILDAFVIIDARWFITGEGDMLNNRSSDIALNTEATTIHKSDQKDNELLAEKDEIIATKNDVIESLKENVETQKDLISTLKLRIKELECSSPFSKPDAFPSARSAASTGGASQSKKTK